MAVSLPRERDLDRLGKLCGLLGSDHDGERAAAALKATALLRACGITWAEFFDSLKPVISAIEGRPGSVIPHRKHALECLDSVEPWSAKETDFLSNMARKRRPPTPAQAEWLSALLDRARSRMAA